MSPLSGSETHDTSEQFGRSPRLSFRSHLDEQTRLAIAEESIARDLASERQDGNSAVDDVASEDHTAANISRIRAPSIIAASIPFIGTQQPETIMTAEQERDAILRDQQTLLQDNNLIPSKVDRTSSGGGEPSETTALLGNNTGDPEAQHGDGGSPLANDIDAKWEAAVLNGQIQTTWRREGKVISRYAAPLTLTFLLQNSLTLTSTFVVGHIGKNELGAVALGAMTASITGYSIFHGLTTSLDTLCAQAYGSGNKHLVGLQMQRMIVFLWFATIPIACVWFFGTNILRLIVPEREIAELAGSYLRVLILGAPGYACFESAKRFVQAQGRFSATLYVLLIAAPLNIFLQWLFVWVSLWPSEMT